MKHSIGNVKYEHRIWAAKVLQIDLHCLLREQMEGDGIAAKSIEDQHIEFLRARFTEFALERKTRIAWHNLDFRRRIADVCEIRFRSRRIADGLGIEFIDETYRLDGRRPPRYRLPCR